MGELRTTDIRSPKRSEQQVSSACSASPATLITTCTQRQPTAQALMCLGGTVIMTQTLRGTNTFFANGLF